ncbi:hypothetical protein D3C84_1310940 [compost metagenome]
MRLQEGDRERVDRRQIGRRAHLADIDSARIIELATKLVFRRGLRGDFRQEATRLCLVRRGVH